MSFAQYRQPAPAGPSSLDEGDPLRHEEIGLESDVAASWGSRADCGPFDLASARDYEMLQPVWDLRPCAIRRNTALPPAMGGLKLHLAGRSAFLELNRVRDVCGSPGLLEHSIPEKLLRVIRHWQRGEALSPPVFMVDGHHRGIVALLSKAPLIPFYCREAVDLEGITPCDVQHPRQARWTAD